MQYSTTSRSRGPLDWLAGVSTVLDCDIPPKDFLKIADVPVSSVGKHGNALDGALHPAKGSYGLGAVGRETILDAADHSAIQPIRPLRDRLGSRLDVEDCLNVPVKGEIEKGIEILTINDLLGALDDDDTRVIPLMQWSWLRFEAIGSREGGATAHSQLP